MSNKKKKKNRKKKKTPSSSSTTTTTTTTKRVNNSEGDDNILWRLVTDHPDIFDTHIVTKLNDNEIKFFYDVNSESRMAMKRSGVQLPNAFKIGDFNTKSILSWALEKCPGYKELLCGEMARNGKLELLKFLRSEGCPWNTYTCTAAAHNGQLECLKYAHAKGCRWDKYTCEAAAYNLSLIHI